MTKILRAAATAAFLLGFANTANALTPMEALPVSTDDIAAATSPIVTPKRLPYGATIAVARLDGGRLIPTPHGEAFDWDLLAMRTGAPIELLDAGRALDYIPEIPFHGVDTDNKIDEVRLTAANEGYSHVILYGVGPDARWSSFGGKALVETGLSVDEDCTSWISAKAKALLVDSHTGDVLGAATADNIEFHIGALADDVERLLSDLT